MRVVCCLDMFWGFYGLVCEINYSYNIMILKENLFLVLRGGVVVKSVGFGVR